MKKILFIVSLISSMGIYAQTWKFESQNSDFDGKYKTAYVQGTGQDYPYNKPVLTINKFEKTNQVNFYISRAGYFQEGSNTKIQFVFNNEKDVIYSTSSFNYSPDGKTLFLNEFHNPITGTILSKYEFIQKLQKASRLSVRISNNYGKNDLSFSLSGSSAAINFIIPANELTVVIEDHRMERKALEEKNKLRNNKLDELLQYAIDMKLNDLNALKKTIERDLGLKGARTIRNFEEYDSLKFAPSYNFKKGFGNVEIFYTFREGSEERIPGFWKVSDDSPLFDSVQLEEETDRKIFKEKFLTKYKIEELQNYIYKRIKDTDELLHYDTRDIDILSSVTWSIDEISSVTAIFNEFYGTRILGYIYLNFENRHREVINLVNFPKEITKKELIEVGIPLDKEF